ELPLLREPLDRLAERLAAIGLNADPAGEPRRLGYKPLHRVVLGVGGHVVKGYATEAKLDAAARGLRFAEQTGIRTAAYEARIDELGSTVQTSLAGSIATDDRRLAPLAGAFARELHEGEPNGLPRVGPDRQLRAAAESAHLVSSLLPQLGARTHHLVESLERALADETEL